ncbi:macro domain-containing protein [Celerinatantimonas diazotrophica]|uniref:O-acetyl-ADP-ribose deacetylase (Regulator of RNase III) n=1 Tax=Celerinatantimonas diazotrophica TaxID=412034 RepID=A0A4R1JA81_9GAMM|nr:macro domain-containing protein [Celerinatantimonas diazotrophica]TCK47546.1 O-acetyl-ADP-ribose deacetylase (regulator of RNase III) [Celerinatantimonas diazotrophica]CAG9296836.1 O-acetyl-ADP-ribose deacetylase [Celerinatantimonas diazotrophica]
MGQIHILKGDITTAQVDAIVNAANSRMLGGGGVDGAIHRAAGPKLLAECKNVPSVNGQRCPTGEARITSAGNLSASYVIHTVGPIYNIDKAPREHLINAYENSFKLALSHACQSIAFPAISCGVYMYPHHEAAEIALNVALEYVNHFDIYFYLFDEPLFNIFKQTYRQLTTI